MQPVNASEGLVKVFVRLEPDADGETGDLDQARALVAELEREASSSRAP
jgi:hypothetical protein